MKILGEALLSFCRILFVVIQLIIINKNMNKIHTIIHTHYQMKKNFEFKKKSITHPYQEHIFNLHVKIIFLKKDAKQIPKYYTVHFKYPESDLQ